MSEKGQSPHSSIPHLNIGVEGVAKQLQNLNPNKASSPDEMPPRLLTQKWSRGVPMDRKISFRASARKRRISWRCRFLTFTCLPPHIFWHVFEKNHAAHCAAIALGSLWTPVDHQQDALDKNNFPHTRDLWPLNLVAIHKYGLMILSHLNTN